MNRLLVAFVMFVRQRLIGNIIPAVIIYLFWLYGLQNSAGEALGTAIVAFVLLSLGDMIALYFFKGNAVNHKKHAR
ncbi:hypothetical protein [Paenibacillus hunanensis]|uniref:Uncharacterized protein n=1 Tax=Paenibacillus hunanensis TaxID=539262 RepID=A0ABU1IUU2_9BACL|nr:hypothetical protein [Paenibacillus hunanensis]MCL9661684.1 hypothetical protein [Paenibacillus hunanensis]MDR6242780.1 hypothetical protein [Paenibacillus hunanensis]GGJ02622.1 hypothetical protein GCM10008022_09550 [Paenibacillus hunanensis]